MGVRQHSMADFKDFEGLVELLNISEKAALERHCKDLVVYSTDFVGLLLGARAGVLESYKYACHFDQRTPTHLLPTDEELGAMSQAKVGPAVGKAKKAITKMWQSLEERRVLAAHLIYTPCHRYWHLFYFDQRDRAEDSNHWVQGPHIHYSSNLYATGSALAIWEGVLAMRFPKSLHLRYADVKQSAA